MANHYLKIENTTFNVEQLVTMTKDEFFKAHMGLGIDLNFAWNRIQQEIKTAGLRPQEKKVINKETLKPTADGRDTKDGSKGKKPTDDKTSNDGPLSESTISGPNS